MGNATLPVARWRYPERMKKIVLDIETTGLYAESGDRIVEIACLELIDGRRTANTYYVRINPECPVSAGAATVHGMTWGSLQHEPVFAAIARSLYAFIAGSELIMHNAPFRLSFLKAEFSRLGMPPPAKICVLTDTLVLARTLHPDEVNNLDSLCSRYGLVEVESIAPDIVHNLERLAEVYLAMVDRHIPNR